MSETEANSEAEVEGTAEGESKPFLNNTDLAFYMIKNTKVLILGIVISVILFIYMLKKSNMRVWKKIIISLIPFIISFIYMFITYSPKPSRYYFLSVLYRDKPINTGFNRKSGDWMFTGSAILDIDGIDHIFIGGGKNQDDVLLVYNNKTKQFDNVIDGTGLSSKSSTFSAVSINLDPDKNNLDDLIVGRKDGVYLYKQNKKLKFEKTKIHEGQDKSPLALSVSDYNKDGKPDIYVSYFIPKNKYRGTLFNDPSHNRSNVMLKNTSTNNNISFVDATIKSGSSGKYNTFTSAFVDLNNDNLPDLVLSNDSGYIEILENQNNKFKTHDLKDVGLGNWMGIAVGDYDSDGDQDLFLTNIGDDIDRDKFSLGDIRKNQKQAFEHALLRNDGNFKFVNIAKEKGIDKGFGWGAMFGDLNYDGKLDLIFAENFMANPLHWIFPGVGRYFTQGNNNNFKRNFNYQNPHFGQTPLFGDVNKDGHKDVIWINYNGPSKVYLNKNTNNFINVKLPETTEFTNAKVILIDNNNKKQYREIIQGGVGFGSDSTNMISFGLNNNAKIKSITVETIYGKKYSVNNPKVNSTLTLNTLKKK